MSAAAENSWVPQCRQRLTRYCDVEGTIGSVLIVFARRAPMLRDTRTWKDRPSSNSLSHAATDLRGHRFRRALFAI